jgi:hypothetical protein
MDVSQEVISRYNMMKGSVKLSVKLYFTFQEQEHNSAVADIFF